MIDFGSVCSGIEAMSVANEHHGYRAAWLAEIEPFPAAVLAHHWPDVPNLGDMTAIAGRVLSGRVAAPEVLVGGTPCQAFSVAGMRAGMADPRGLLTIRFVELADAIDHVRTRAGQPECVVWWENVPGVLSDTDNAFGCFLAALVGESEPLVPSGGKWTDAGCVYGPARAVAWRVLDAQYFGLAQRRRRVFVVASARNGFDPARVLFESDGLRRDSAPRREAGQNPAAGLGPSTAGGGGVQTVAPTLDASFARLQGCSGQDMNHGHGHLVAQAFGGNNTAGAIDVATARNACASASASGRMDFESETFLVQATAHTLRGEGFDASCDGTGRGTPRVPVAFDTTQITSAANRSNPKPGDPCHPLVAQGHAPAIAFHPTQDPISSTDGTTHCIGTGSSGGCATVAVAFHENQRAEVTVNDTAGTLKTSGGKPGQGYPAVLQAMAVRRLTPRECERLQGFPDDYTLIPWRTWQEAKRKGFGKSYESLLQERGMRLREPASEECPHGPRYKALGNSMAVPVMAWIGRRLAHALRGEA